MTVDTTASALAPKTTSDHPVGGGHETGPGMCNGATGHYTCEIWVLYTQDFHSHAEMVL